MRNDKKKVVLFVAVVSWRSAQSGFQFSKGKNGGSLSFLCCSSVPKNFSFLFGGKFELMQAVKETENKLFTAG